MNRRQWQLSSVRKPNLKNRISLNTVLQKGRTDASRLGSINTSVTTWARRHQAHMSAWPPRAVQKQRDNANMDAMGPGADVALFEILPSSFAIGKHLEP